MDMKQITDHYQSGQLSQALESAQAYVRKAPADENGRWLLFQLYCLCAEYTKAEKQLDFLTHSKKDDPLAAASLMLLANILKGETTRREFFTGAVEAPHMMDEDEALLLPSLNACKAIINAQANGESYDYTLRPLRHARCQTMGNTLEGEFVEADDPTAHGLEVLTHDGKYYWMAWEKIDSIAFTSYEKPFDLLMRQAIITRKTDQSEEPLVINAFVPAIYPWTPDTDLKARMGKSTDWLSADNDAYVYGVGQKCFLIGDDLVPILQIESLDFVGTEGAEATA
ncbi:MAG: hypothetical protein MI754_00330 [Chromatiales bacterium]|nr:hypothetical protein [Chromatiales bacterium]